MKVNVKRDNARTGTMESYLGNFATQALGQLIQVLGLKKISVSSEIHGKLVSTKPGEVEFFEGTPESVSESASVVLEDIAKLMAFFNIGEFDLSASKEETKAIHDIWEQIRTSKKSTLEAPPTVVPDNEKIEITL